VRTTLDVTIRRLGEPDAARPYSKLVAGPGEPYLWRDDLGIASRGGLAQSPNAPGVTSPAKIASPANSMDVPGPEAATAVGALAGVVGAESAGFDGSAGVGSIGGVGGFGSVADVVQLDGTAVLDGSVPDAVAGVDGVDGVGSTIGGDSTLVDPWAGAKALLRLVHMTDTHVIDASSPARAESVQLAAKTDSRWDIMVPMHRPHELLQQHALAAMVDTINGLSSAPVSGDPLDVVIVTGDCVDNAQRNELNAYLALLDGGVVHLRYDGVQSVEARVGGKTAIDTEGLGDLGVGTEITANAGSEFAVESGLEIRHKHDDEIGHSEFWCPDPLVDDVWKRAYGFPSYAGLLKAVGEPIVCGGLKLPWLGVVGNHDWLRQGTAKTSAVMEAIAVGSKKSTGMPPGFLPEDALIAYLEEPASYNVGASVRSVRADADRVGITAEDFIRAHIESAHRSPSASLGASSGHGFGVDLENLRPDYVADFGVVRIIAIDTNHPAGHYQGSVGLAQLAWLEERLLEANNVYVLIASHHPTEALTNETRAEGFADDRVLADPVAALLHRHPCVIGWLTGHRHHHRVKAHRDPLGVNQGFWEITTSSIIDWPSQARILEVLQLADGQIVLASTVIDHNGTIDPGPQAAESLAGLAGAHREIAAAHAVQRGESFLRRAPGRPSDRNVILPVR
jgi:metallophosphoesterase (TIGR03767 family)